MYKFILKSLLVNVLFIALLASCQEQTEPCILTEQSFKDAVLKAEKEQKYLCVVLIDSLQRNPQELLNRQLTGKFKFLSKKAIFNIVDIRAEKNRWYEKWLCPFSVPFICVFSPDGTLMNLLPGLTSESFAYMEKTIKEGQTDNEYYCYNRFEMNKNKYVVAMNHVLQSKRKFDIGENIETLIDSIVTQVRYPYSLFLKLQNEERQRDSVNMTRTSKELLSINTPYELLLYTEEFIEAKKILDPFYDIANEPYLEIKPAIVEIGQCQYHEKIPFFIVLENTGNKPIKITTIETSCSCVTFLGENNWYEILPHDSIQMPFEFQAEQKGDVERVCYFVSNARNPVIDVKVLATVDSE